MTEASAPYLRPTTLKTSPAVRPTCRQGNQSSTRPSVATRVAPRPAPGWSCSGAQEPEGWGAVGALGPVRVGSPRTHDPHPAPRYSTFCLCPPHHTPARHASDPPPSCSGREPRFTPSPRWDQGGRRPCPEGQPVTRNDLCVTLCPLLNLGLRRKTQVTGTVVSSEVRPAPRPPRRAMCLEDVIAIPAQLSHKPGPLLAGSLSPGERSLTALGVAPNIADLTNLLSIFP